MSYKTGKMHNKLVFTGKTERKRRKQLWIGLQVTTYLYCFHNMKGDD